MKKMLSKRRGILAVLALSMIVASTAGAMFAFSCRGLPEPAKANRQELLRWLIATDLAEQTPETQLTLAERLEAEFGSGIDWAAFQSRLNDAERQQLFRNIPCVLRPWILKKANAYAQMAADQKTAFLDRLLDTLEVWRGVEKLLPQTGASDGVPAKSPKLATILTREIDKLQKDAPLAQQELVGKFWTDVKLHWFLRSFSPKSQS
jgi:hypothetical protein